MSMIYLIPIVRTTTRAMSAYLAVSFQKSDSYRQGSIPTIGSQYPKWLARNGERTPLELSPVEGSVTSSLAAAI